MAKTAASDGAENCARMSTQRCPMRLSAAAAQAFGADAHHHDDQPALINALRREVQARAAAGEGASLRVLVKGSRSSAMERVVSALLDLTEDTTDAA